MIHINYPELLHDGKWGDNKVMIQDDVDLLSNTGFNELGYCILDTIDNSELLQNFIKKQIYEKTKKQFFDLEK